MRLDRFLKCLTAIEWQTEGPEGLIRTTKLFPADPDKWDNELQMDGPERRCPLAAVADCYTDADVEDFAEATGLDEAMCSDIISAADYDAGLDHEGNQRPFTKGRSVESLPQLREQMLRACGLPVHT